MLCCEEASCTTACKTVCPLLQRKALHDSNSQFTTTGVQRSFKVSGEVQAGTTDIVRELQGSGGRKRLRKTASLRFAYPVNSIFFWMGSCSYAHNHVTFITLPMYICSFTYYCEMVLMKCPSPAQIRFPR